MQILIKAALVALPAFAFQMAAPNLMEQARAELFAARYDRAIELYRTALAQEPSTDAYYGLTRALLRAHRSKEAYAAAEEGLKRGSEKPGAQTAAGLAMFRKGEIVQAERHFNAALRIDPNYSGAL